MRNTLALVRLLLAILPAVFIGLWGFGYLRSCWQAILAPGVPVTLQLQTPGGPVSFDAASYSFQPRQGYLVVTGATLRDPKGVLLAAADRLDVRGIDIVDLPRSKLTIRANGVSGTLVRNSDGRLELQNLLPKPGKPTQAVPFDLSIDHVDLKVVDNYGSAQWIRNVVATDVSFAGIGNHWLGGASVSVLGAGSGWVSASHQLDGLLVIHSRAENFDLAEIGRHILSTLPSAGSWRSLDASSVKASGPLDIVIAPNVGPRIRFSGAAKIQGFRYAGYTASTASFNGEITESMAGGRLVAAGPGINATYDGSISWGRGGLLVSGQGAASAASLKSLPQPILKFLPIGLAAHVVTYRGSISYDAKNGTTVVGQFSANDAAYKKDSVRSFGGQVRIDGTSVWAEVPSVQYRTAKLAGEVAYNWKSKQLNGSVRGSGIDVSTLLERFPQVSKSITGVPSGKLAAYTLLSGTIDKPEVDFRVTGEGSYRESDLPREIDVNRVSIRGQYRDGIVQIERFRARTPAGALSAIGSVNVDNRQLSISVDGRGLDVGDFTNSVTGLASVKGVVAGSFDKPRFEGQLEGYDLTYQGSDIELVTGHLTADKTGIDANSVDLVVGSSQLSGKLAIALPSRALSGEFSSPAIQLGDLIGDTYAGLVAVKTTELGGTLDDPVIAASISGNDLLAQDLQISTVNAHAALHGRKLSLDTLHAKTANGSIDATGHYDFDAKSGAIDAQAKSLDLAAIAPALQKENRSTVAGTVSGNADFAFADNEVSGITGSGTLTGIKMNGTDLGQGIWNVSGDLHHLKGSLQSSFGTRFVALENATADLDAETLDADVVASNLAVQNLYQSILPFLTDANQSAIQKLAYLDGELKVKGHVSGKWSDPDLAITNFETDNLSYNGIAFGSLTASAKRSAGNWDVSSLRLTDGEALASIHGTFDENGQMNLDGEFGNFDLAKIGDAISSSSNWRGLTSGSFLATGSSRNPLIHASVDAESEEIEGRRVDFGLDLNSIIIDGKSIEAAGAVTLQGFHGQLKAHVPFTYPFTVPDGEDITAQLTLNQRPLSDLAPYSPELDPKKAQGALNGALAVTGTKGALHVSGGISASASLLGFRMLDPGSKPTAPKYFAMSTELKDVILSLGVQDSDVTADFSAKSSVNGSVDGKATTKLAALNDLLSGRGVGDLEAWLTGSLTGNVAFSNLGAKESNHVINGAVALNGGLTLGGSLSAPAISGTVDVTNLSMAIPGLKSQPGSSSTPTIDPQFNIDVNLTKPGHISTSLASIDLSGNGHIGGSMSQPDASATLSVVKGDIRLPGGQVHLDKGGYVRPTYQADSGGMPVAHVMVDLLGTGHVTDIRGGDIAQRYDIHLDVIGDLLAPDQVNFTATSDPPDLTQDQILALLGRTDLLTALGSNTTYSQGERNLQSAFIGYALPSLFDPLTARLAANLKLDYISVEYNALDQTSLLAAKTLGYGFSIQARRQVSEPIPGYPLTYDYRLVYQLPLRSVFARRFSFFVGRDELTQWKIGFQYGQRL